MGPVKFSTVDEYFNALTPESLTVLLRIRELIKQTVPEAVEVLSYQMPAFKYHGMLAYYANAANHYGLYFSPKVVDVFRDKVDGLDCSKAAVRFAKGQPLPEALIIEMVTAAKHENEVKKILKDERNWAGKRRKK